MRINTSCIFSIEEFMEIIDEYFREIRWANNIQYLVLLNFCCIESNEIGKCVETSRNIIFSTIKWLTLALVNRELWSIISCDRNLCISKQISRNIGLWPQHNLVFMRIKYHKKMMPQIFASFCTHNKHVMDLLGVFRKQIFHVIHKIAKERE